MAATPTTHIETLPNGLKILVVPRPGVQVVTVDMWVAVGSADEPPALNGASHFLEHMLFKGTERYGVGEIDRIVESVGGYLNAATSHDYTHYYVTLAAEKLRTAVDIIADVIRSSQLDPEELASERQVILEEYHRKQDDPRGLLWDTLYDKVFETGPYKASVLGTPESLAGIGDEEMREYYHRHYAPENMALLVVGDVQPDEAVAAATDALAGFDRPFRPMLDQGPPPTLFQTGVEEILEKDLNETYGIMAFPAPSIEDHGRAYAVDVLQFILGSGRASILYQEIKEKRRLATTISAGYPTSAHPDVFYVYYTCEESKRAELEQAVLEQLDRAAQSPPTAEQLDRAKKLLTNTHAFSLETTSGQSSSIGYYYTITGDVQFERDYAEGVAAVTAERAQDEAQRCLRPETLNRVRVRPRSDASGEGGC